MGRGVNWFLGSFLTTEVAILDSRFWIVDWGRRKRKFNHGWTQPGAAGTGFSICGWEIRNPIRCVGATARRELETRNKIEREKANPKPEHEKRPRSFVILWSRACCNRIKILRSLRKLSWIILRIHTDVQTCPSVVKRLFFIQLKYWVAQASRFSEEPPPRRGEHIS